MKTPFFALSLAAAGLANAQQPMPAVPQGKPATSERLRDAEFGVATRQFGLQRQVEMYQWSRAGEGYQAAWATSPVDSSGFDAAHANPGAFPVQARYWIATRATLDGKPLDEDVLKELGNWQRFRPGFSALPGNLAATFQPEGDGLSSAENPLAPQIGDLRITWHRLSLPPLAGKVMLQDSVWVVGPVAAQPGVMVDADAHAAQNAAPLQRWLLPIAAAALVIGIGILIRSRRRRNRRSRVSH